VREIFGVKNISPMLVRLRVLFHQLGSFLSAAGFGGYLFDRTGSPLQLVWLIRDSGLSVNFRGWVNLPIDDGPVKRAGRRCWA